MRRRTWGWWGPRGNLRRLFLLNILEGFVGVGRVGTTEGSLGRFGCIICTLGLWGRERESEKEKGTFDLWNWNWLGFLALSWFLRRRFNPSIIFFFSFWIITKKYIYIFNYRNLMWCKKSLIYFVARMIYFNLARDNELSGCCYWLLIINVLEII